MVLAGRLSFCFPVSCVNSYVPLGALLYDKLLSQPGKESCCMGKVNFPYLSRSLPDHPLSGGWWLLDAFPGLELALALKGVDNEMRSRFLRIRPELMERMEL